MQFPPTSYHFIPLRSKYSSQRPLRKYLHSIIFPWCPKQSLTPIQNCSQNYKRIYSNFYMFDPPCSFLSHYLNPLNCNVTIHITSFSTTKRFCILHTECIFTFCMKLRIGSDYFPTHHYSKTSILRFLSDCLKQM
jgi:hypothetical protein